MNWSQNHLVTEGNNEMIELSELEQAFLALAKSMGLPEPRLFEDSDLVAETNAQLAMGASCPLGWYLNEARLTLVCMLGPIPVPLKDIAALRVVNEINSNFSEIACVTWDPAESSLMISAPTLIESPKWLSESVLERLRVAVITTADEVWQLAQASGDTPA